MSSRMVISVAVVLFVTAGCGSDDDGGSANLKDPTLVEVADWMAGHFSNSEQAAKDPNFINSSYRLKRIWNEEGDGYWLYVESGETGKSPFYIRVGRLALNDEGAVNYKIFEFKDKNVEKQVAGAWNKEKPLADKSKDDIKEAEKSKESHYFERKGDCYEVKTLSATYCADGFTYQLGPALYEYKLVEDYPL